MVAIAPDGSFVVAWLNVLRRFDANGAPLTGEIPRPTDPPSGCVFHTRCHRFIEGTCDAIEPEMRELSAGHTIKCHLTEEQLVEVVPSRSSTTDPETA